MVSWQGIAEATVPGKSPLEKGAREGDSPVHWFSLPGRLDRAVALAPESGCLGMQP